MIYSYMFVGSNRMKCSLGGNDGGEKKNGLFRPFQITSKFQIQYFILQQLKIIDLYTIFLNNLKVQHDE